MNMDSTSSPHYEHSHTSVVFFSGIVSVILSILAVSAAVQQRWIPLASPGIRSTGTGDTTVVPPVTRDIVREESAVVDAVQRAEPAVVSVIVTKDLPVLEQVFEEIPFGPQFFFDPFMSPFDLRVPRVRQKGTERREVGGGTAFFVSRDGLLMTNKHVVEDEEADYTVLLNDGKKLEAKIVGRDPASDIALLKVDGKDFPALTLSKEEPVLGQSVIAIGNALGEFRNTVSVGVISGLRRSITAGNPQSGAVEQLNRIIQTDAAINQGNSGGPLLSLEGEVIGMNTAIAGGAQNIAFAIPAGDLRRVLGSFQEHGRILRPYLGVRYVPVTKEVKEKNNLPVDEGVLVVRGESPSDPAVLPGSPADKAGIVENDIILEIDGLKLDADTSLANIVQSKLPGDIVKLTVLHKGEEKELSMKLEKWKE